MRNLVLLGYLSGFVAVLFALSFIFTRLFALVMFCGSRRLSDALDLALHIETMVSSRLEVLTLAAGSGGCRRQHMHMELLLEFVECVTELIRGIGRFV